MTTEIKNQEIEDLNWQIKQTWGKLTDEDLELFEMSDVELIKIIQKIYGHSETQAQEEINNFKLKQNQYFRDGRETITKENTMASSQYGGQMEPNIKTRAQHLIEEDIIEPAQKYMTKARELGAKAVDKSAEVVRENPGYSMLGAAAVGFLAGAYFSRRK